MSPVVDATSAADDPRRAESLAQAVDAVRAGEVVVIPTDTVYGIGCDAFSPDAVEAVLAAKGRGRDMPPPVLVPDVRTVDGLARDVPAWARTLVEHYWPGPLTLVLRAQPSLRWDLGETAGTVALRMPDDEVALAVLEAVGPMAVTSANLTGQPPATSIADAAAQLGPAVQVYVDGGPRDQATPSTILDCTGERPVLLREGALAMADIEAVLEPSWQDRPEPAAADPAPAVPAGDAGPVDPADRAGAAAAADPASPDSPASPTETTEDPAR